jgi:hypothetical protein
MVLHSLLQGYLYLFFTFSVQFQSRLTILNEVLNGFHQSLQANGKKVPQLGYDHLLPDPFQFTIRFSLYHSTLYDNALK